MFTKEEESNVCTIVQNGSVFFRDVLMHAYLIMTQYFTANYLYRQLCRWRKKPLHFCKYWILSNIFNFIFGLFVNTSLGRCKTIMTDCICILCLII